MRLVPTNRLLGVVGSVFLPLSVVVAFIPASGAIAVFISLTVIAVVLLDAYKGSGKLRGIHAILPDIVRLSKFRDAEFEVHIKNEMMQMQQIRLGLAFPDEIFSPAKQRFARLTGDSTDSILQWPCRGLKNGRYILDRYYLGVTSPLRLWAVHRSFPVRLEIRVYPNLMVERKNLSSLFLNRGLGIHAQRQVGKGREFEQLREYLPGDSFEDIHWKATARRGQPITKVFQIERTQQIYLIVDSSRLSARNIALPNESLQTSGGGGVVHTSTILERYITATLVMCLAAERQGDLFGLVTFHDRVNQFLGANSGKSHFDSCRDAIYTLQPRVVTPDFRELFAFIGSRIRRRALLIFLTHLDDPLLAESFADSIDILSRKHVVLVNMLRPPEARPLFSASRLSSVDEIYQQLGGHLVWKGIAETEKVLKRRGVGFAMLDNESFCTDMISQYLTLKRRQVL
jgi:uncharacterized protein (DUF58 family)